MTGRDAVGKATVSKRDVFAGEGSHRQSSQRRLQPERPPTGQRFVGWNDQDLGRYAAAGETLTAIRPTRSTEASVGGGSSPRLPPPFRSPASSCDARIADCSRKPNRIPARASNHPLMPQAVGFVRDTQPFCEARFSCRQLKRFVTIALHWAIADQKARKAAHQPNLFRGANLASHSHP